MQEMVRSMRWRTGQTPSEASACDTATSKSPIRRASHPCIARAVVRTRLVVAHDGEVEEVRDFYALPGLGIAHKLIFDHRHEFTEHRILIGAKHGPEWAGAPTRKGGHPV